MQPKIIILGGGYAGLAALVALREHRLRAEVLLIDRGSAHIERTRLHELIRHPGSSWQIPFHQLEQRFDCRYLQAEIRFGLEDLERWQQGKTVFIVGQKLAFDYLIVATGSRSKLPPPLLGALTPDDLAGLDFPAYLRRKLAIASLQHAWITVAGAGASGIQFLFELDAWRRQWQDETGRGVGLRLVNDGQVVLGQFSRRMQEYAFRRILQASIQYLDHTLLLACEPDRVRLQNKVSSEEQTLPSALTLACLGLAPNPFAFKVNTFGQILSEGRALERVFAAGDCSVFPNGANTLSAQVAVHKGRLVAENIVRHCLGLALKPYRFRETGYFISLGPADGVGWLDRSENIVTGLPAFFIKQAVETLYELSIL